MSFFDSIESAVTQLRSSIGTELKSTEKNLGHLLSDTASMVDDKFEIVFAKIRNILDSATLEMKTKLESVEALLVEAKNEIENGAETAYQTFLSKTETEIKRIGALASESVTALTAAGKYIKDKAENDVKLALDTAKAGFKAAKNAFEDDVTKIVDKAISLTKDGVQKLIDDAKLSASKLNELRIDVETEVKAKFHKIEDDLKEMKKKFSKEMDEVVSYGRTEGRKVEKKFEVMAADVKKVSNVVALAAFGFCVAAAIGIIYMKEKRVQSEFEEWKKSRGPKPWDNPKK